MATNQTQSAWARTALRLPPDLHREVHAAALREGRSFNGQIVAALRQSHSVISALPTFSVDLLVAAKTAIAAGEDKPMDAVQGLSRSGLIRAVEAFEARMPVTSQGIVVEEGR